jgi:NAD(P)-dependent dehydrogenase (short-subunit alcohol dehydrogenase family)
VFGEKEGPIDQDDAMKTVVMTGATAGLGKVAAQQMAKTPDTHLIIGARGGRVLPGITVLPLDLAGLASVRAFAEAVLGKLDGSEINALVLNAGAQFPMSTSAQTTVSRRPSRLII